MDNTDGPMQDNSKVFKITDIFFTSLNVAVYSVFIFFITRLLKRQNQYLDIYMKSSVLLFGLSTLLMFSGTIIYY